jgi:hypothetical protein
LRLSAKHRFIALANPRCGSTSIRHAINEYSDIRSGGNCRLSHHCALRTVEPLVNALGFKIEEFFVFTTVRNPWDRAVSIYHYGLKNPKSAWHTDAKNSKGFKDFLYSDMLLRHFRPELASRPLVEGPYNISSFLATRNGVQIGRAFKVEEIEVLKTSLSEHMGFEINIPHVNATKHSDYRQYYDDSSRERVSMLFSEDIKMFNYTFE